MANSTPPQVGGFWVYPVLAVLDPVPRTAFLVVCSLFGGALYLFGHGVNAIIWGKEEEEEEYEEMYAKREKMYAEAVRVEATKKRKKPKKA